MEDAIAGRWRDELRLLGLAHDTAEDAFAKGGLAVLAVPPTVRITVLPADPGAQVVPAEAPSSVLPLMVALPTGAQLARHERVRGTASGYVTYGHSRDGLWTSFMALYWHGGVDAYLGDEGGRDWPVFGTERRVIFLQRSIGWAWAAFELQREMIERFSVPGPFRAVVAVANAGGASLGNLGAGWAGPGDPGVFDLPEAIEPRVLLSEDLSEWPDAEGVEALAVRFGAKLDLVFGGNGTRHLDRLGPDEGKFALR